MISQSLVRYGEPLEQRDSTTPEPTGHEVLLKISRCGVCHSDLHIQDGFFDLGGDKKLDLAGGHSLPLTMGHEIAGEVVSVGPDAAALSNSEAVKSGDRRAVYPWIGCGKCPICQAGDEHLCSTPRNLGVNVDGGYSDYLIVPHPRYLLDYTPLPAELAAAYMCSGLTAYGALRKIGNTAPGASIVLVGLGGVGMMGLQFARALFPDGNLIGVDVDQRKLQAALAAGASAVYDSGDPSTAKAILSTTDGAFASVDFVGSEASLGLANRVVRKGGKVIIVGLFGGRWSTPIPLFPLRAITISGSYVGSLNDAKAMLELAKAGRVAPIPIEERPLAQAGKTLDDLRQGKVVGRVVLRCD